MNNLQKLKAMKGSSPFQVPLKVLVVAVATTSRYRKNDQERTCTEVGVADASAAMKMLCYDETKLATIKENATVLLRNIIVRDGNLIVTSVSKVSTSSGVNPTEELKAEAKALVVLPPSPALTIVEARLTGLDSLVTIQGKIIKEEAVAYRDMQRTGEVGVPVKNIVLQDMTAETKVGLWRLLASAEIKVGQYVKITDLRINKYKGEISFNTTSKSLFMGIDAPVEVIKVIVDGHYMENEETILVCCIKDTETYVDYVVEGDMLKTIQEDGDVEKLQFPLEAFVTVKKIDNKDIIQSITIM